MDGNGRMGRIWQTLILGQWNQLFFLLPIESLIKDQQEPYYQALETADQVASSTIFIEFMLDVINAVLAQNDLALQSSSDQVSDQVGDQVRRLLAVMDNQYWSAQELMNRLSLSHKPTFRKNYLNPALKARLLLMQYPERPRSPKQKYKKNERNV
jgi:Fic family protein